MTEHKKEIADLAARNAEMLRFFESHTVGYDDVHMKMMDNKRRITDKLPENPRRILDLGAGTGLELIPLFERYPDAQVVALDLTPSMLEDLKKRPFADRVETVCGSFFTAEFGLDYDAVISSAALHHFDEVDKLSLYRKIYVCLRPGGRFINSDRCVATQAEQEERFRELREEPGKYVHHDTPLTVENERILLTEAGFTEFEAEAMPDGKYTVITVVKK